MERILASVKVKPGEGGQKGRNATNRDGGRGIGKTGKSSCSFSLTDAGDHVEKVHP